MKDSPEVVEFMNGFSELSALDLAPSALKAVAESDDAVKHLCSKVFFAAWSLSRAERFQRELFASPTDPMFISKFRQYESQFEQVVSDIVFAESFDLHGAIASGTEPRSSKLECEWENADEDGHEQAAGIENAIEFALDQATQEGRQFPDGFSETIEDSVQAWKDTKRSIGFDLQGIFRRRDLVPFVLVPRHVASKYGLEKISLFTYLMQAHDAFVLGVPFAALALMRSILETVLKDHYLFRGRLNKSRKLSDLICDCNSLPNGISKERLLHFKCLADDVLHANQFEGAQRQLESKRFEFELISFLLVLRALIEFAPESSGQSGK